MTPPAPDTFLDPLMRNRQTVGIVLAVLALLFLAAGGYSFVKAYSDAPAAETDKPTLTVKDDAKEADAKLLQPYHTEYLLGGVFGILCALVCGVGGGLFIGMLQSTDEVKNRRVHRLLVFFVGAALGIAMLCLGFLLFYLWFGELVKWLGQADKAEPLKPLLAVLALLLGAGLLFAGVQPLRAEERNDALLRRIVYGTNFFLTTLLLVVGLIFVNVLATLKLPSKLDTSESGFYTLSKNTTDYLATLDQQVVIYTTIQESREGTDALRVLNAFQEANPKQVKLKQLSLTLDKGEIAALKTKFPSADIVDAEGRISRLGLVLAIGPDEKRYQFIEQAELFGREAGQQGPGRKTFQAEPRIIREILFLTENKRKPVIYFTQGAGEISIEAGGPPDRNARPGERLKQGLIGDYCEVKPLRFDGLGVDPKVPEDATAVVVADPTAKLSESTVTALRNYMNAKGKMLVMAGAHRDPTNPKVVLTIGLEPLLAQYDITLRDRVLYSQPADGLPANAVVAGCAQSSVNAKNTIALAFLGTGFVFGNARPLSLGENSKKAKPLFVTAEDRVNWVEPALAANPRQAFDNIVAMSQAKRGDLLEEREVSKVNRILAAVASDTEPAKPNEPEKVTNRLVVFGHGGFEDSEQGADGRSLSAELVTASVNWLRDRPAVANEGAKPYGVYTPNPKFDWTRGVTLPVLLVILGISTVGLGLWVVRRR